MITPLPTRTTDLLLVVSPANAEAVYMPFYFLYLAGYLEKHGFSVDIVETHAKDRKENIQTILRDIAIRRPRFIGLASFVTDYDIVVSLAKEIKKRSDVKILVGNAHPSIAPEDFLYAGSPFDIVVRGEGELTLKQILTEYRKESDPDLDQIAGIAFLKEGTVKITKNRELMDLSECGMPTYHKIDMRWYQRPTKYIIRRLAMSAAVIYIGRGCPFRCSFCASDSVWQANDRPQGMPAVRKRPMTHVIEELRILQDLYHFDFFYILDDTFGVRRDDIVAFCQAYKESGLEMLWAAETRVNCISDEKIVTILRDAGCIQLDFGVETGSPKLLHRIRKATSVEQTIVAFDLCKKNGIRTFANILLNLPGEEDDDLRLTHELLAKIKPTYTSVGVTMPYPGTEICKAFSRPICKEDYVKFARTLPPEEYRMCTHKHNLKWLLFTWFLRYGIVAPFEKSLFDADTRYWRKILRSRYRWVYALYLAKDILSTFYTYIAFLRHYLRR
jgi:radical SAM superfamily enzyme YgiQ (UPF0313 family)